VGCGLGVRVIVFRAGVGEVEVSAVGFGLRSLIGVCGHVVGWIHEVLCESGSGLFG
jgi:hypothetical protein